MRAGNVIAVALGVAALGVLAYDAWKRRAEIPPPGDPRFYVSPNRPAPVDALSVPPHVNNYGAGFGPGVPLYKSRPKTEHLENSLTRKGPWGVAY